MKTNATKKIVTLVMAFAVLFTTVFTGITPVAAAETTKTAYASADWESATAGSEVKVPFTLTSNNGIEVLIIVPEAVSAKLALYDSTGTTLIDYNDNPLTISTSDWKSYQNLYVYGETWDSLPAGDYYYGMTFATDTQYMIDIEQKSVEAKISQTKATITKGFTKKLSVSGSKVKSWKSGNTKIAKVDKKGKVTAVKAGKTSVYAVLADGTKLACKVTVKENKYSDVKITTSDVSYGNQMMHAYKASYDKSGNLVICTKFANNASYRISKLKNVKITVKSATGKTIGVYKASSISTSVSPYSTKDMKFTIKKSALKIKKADLRNATIQITGTSVYYY